MKKNTKNTETEQKPGITEEFHITDTNISIKDEKKLKATQEECLTKWNKRPKTLPPPTPISIKDEEEKIYAETGKLAREKFLALKTETGKYSKDKLKATQEECLTKWNKRPKQSDIPLKTNIIRFPQPPNYFHDFNPFEEELQEAMTNKDTFAVTFKTFDDPMSHFINIAIADSLIESIYKTEEDAGCNKGLDEVEALTQIRNVINSIDHTRFIDKEQYLSYHKELTDLIEKLIYIERKHVEYHIYNNTVPAKMFILPPYNKLQEIDDYIAQRKEGKDTNDDWDDPDVEVDFTPNNLDAF
jgi:hypothetical protein